MNLAIVHNIISHISNIGPDFTLKTYCQQRSGFTKFNYTVLIMFVSGIDAIEPS